VLNLYEIFLCGLMIFHSILAGKAESSKIPLWSWLWKMQVSDIAEFVLSVDSISASDL